MIKVSNTILPFILTPSITIYLSLRLLNVKNNSRIVYEEDFVKNHINMFIN